MDTYTYPGKGLSLSQLVFALNEELRHTMYSPLTTPDEVSQLERDISTALAAARELKNFFALINRIPLEILSHIPTHLDSQQDVFRASFVCRHWRRALLQHGALWSQLFVEKGEGYVTTLLERAKGSALRVTVDYQSPPRTVALLSPHAQKIRHLEFPYNCWTDVLALSQVNSGQLPLLQTLKISTLCHDDYHTQHSMSVTPSLPLFSSSVNLEEFDLDLDGELVGSLDHFVFPNLTTFNLTVNPIDTFDALQLLDFLKASPTLRTVDVKIYGYITTEGISQHTFVLLPNVKTFSLHGTGDAWHVYAFATHISCPHARYTSLTDHTFNGRMTHDLEIFPDLTSWKTIVHQYTTSPVEEVTVEIDGSWHTTTCTLTFQSSDAAVIRLRFAASNYRAELLELSHEEIYLKVFSQACRTIQGLPLLSHVKRLCIEDKGTLGADYTLPTADLIGAVFESLGPLDELTIRGCNLQRFLLPFINLWKFGSSERVFPHVREFTISEPLIVVDKQWCIDGIEKLAKSQHQLGKPFERVTVHAGGIPMAVAERLKEWVGVVDFHEL